MVDFLNGSNREEEAQDMVRAGQREMFCILLLVEILPQISWLMITIRNIDRLDEYFSLNHAILPVL